MNKRQIFIKFQLITVLIFLQSISYGQTLERTTLSSGGEFDSVNVSLSWSIGEPITETFSENGIILTQGFQQGEMNNVVLPIELLSFQAKRISYETVDLTWTTATELNNKGFFIERKTTNDFEIIDFVTGKGDSETEQTYLFKDKNTFAGDSYYRLRQVDVDETVDYSSIETVEGWEVQPKIIVYPNPATDFMNVEVRIDFITTVQSLNWQLINREGNVILEDDLTINSTITNIAINDIKEVQSGLYFLKIQVNDFQKTMKVIIE